MHKRVLLAEESDTVRGAAESALRQNGFEVISVVSGDKALEVLELSRPDMIIVGTDLEGRGRKPLYEHVQENDQLSAVPLLLLADDQQKELPFPDEVIIRKPIEPKEFIDKVNNLAGKPAQTRSSSDGPNPLSDATLEDDLLDAALGLDQIDVTESEVMDKTQVPENQKKRQSGDGTDTDDLTDSGRVESLLIRDEHAEITHGTPETRKEDPQSSSGKLEILNDQYGLIDRQAANLENDDKAHDYNWFINEMQKDASGFPGGSSDSKTPAEELNFSEPSSLVDPVTPPPEAKQSRSNDSAQSGVDKFIDEFKSEIEKIRSTEPESITVAEDGKAGKSVGTLSWQDSLEKMTPEQINLFTREFINELAEKIAKLIAAKIDEEKLLIMLKREIIQSIEKNQ
ncbi:MAG: hypothetical protein JSV52_09510 [Candidatus Zixiibacteriota bacterium]|nr:MAG: hypothetical protein JSV52_09510 [candidate division Zixibacteria bacterium]